MDFNIEGGGPFLKPSTSTVMRTNKQELSLTTGIHECHRDLPLECQV